MIKTVLYLGLLGLLVLPALQKKFKFFEQEPLKGALPEYVKPKFSVENWWGGSYQDSVDIYIKGTAGFKPSLVRLHNEIHYQLYNVAVANGVIIGKEGYLYEENYIKAHFGQDFVGDEAIKAKVEKIKLISEELDKKGKSFVLVFAPGKASFYPEFVPDHLIPEEIGPTNYDHYVAELMDTDIHFLNFHKWFRDNKASSPYPLVPKTGIHWSKYGEALASDSILNYLESICSCEYPDLVIDTIIKSDQMQDTDDDIEGGMNLFFNISDLTMGYPQFHMETSGSESNLKVLTVADSYYWGMYNFGLSRDYFNRGQFWYYNEHIYSEDIEGSLPPDQVDFGKELEQHDVILFIITDANLYKFGFGFIDDLYTHLNGGEELLKKYIEQINSDPEWKQKVQEKADKNGITLEEAILIDAKFMVKEELSSQNSPD
jgi:hypothetical protein